MDGRNCLRMSRMMGVNVLGEVEAERWEGGG